MGIIDHFNYDEHHVAWEMKNFAMHVTNQQPEALHVITHNFSTKQLQNQTSSAYLTPTYSSLMPPLLHFHNFNVCLLCETFMHKHHQQHIALTLVQQEAL